MPGPWYFAWCDPEELATFGAEHEVMDVDIFTIDLQHREGDFPSLTIVIKNPKIGLLNAGRKRWAWLSWDTGGTDGIVPRFFGRLVAVPDDLQRELVQLTFIARPVDFDEQKRALAETLKVAPYWDPIWVHPESIDDPDAVLQARTALWHVDPVTHVVTISDNIAGEDGTLAFEAGDFFYDPTSMSYTAPPVRTVRVDAEIGWTQHAVGEVDVVPALVKAFRGEGSQESYAISGYTMDGLIDDWPLPGDDIGAGWKVGESDINVGNGTWVNPDSEAENRITVWASTYYGAPSLTSTSEVITNPSVAIDISLGVMRPTMTAAYEARRSFTERVIFDLSADMQAMVSDAGDNEITIISLSSNDVSEPVDPADTEADQVPIIDVRRRSYIRTDRGHDSVEYLIARARAELLDRARAVEIGVEVPFENIVDLSCRKNAQFSDPRLPGGAASGKIIGYRATWDGNSGAAVCGITIGCCVGKGNSVSAVAGTPTYVDEGYVEAGYQVMTGHTVPLAGDVTYTDYDSVEPNDDGIDFLSMSADQGIEEIIISNGPHEQETELDTHYEDVPAAVAHLQSLFTRVCLHMKPLDGGPFETTFPLTVSELMVPKQIDLEAAAS